MAGQPLKLSAVVTLDASQVPAGARATKAEIAGIGTEAATSTTKLQALINAQAGLGSPAANQNVREWSGALAMQGRSLDELRAKYNPLFAVINRYKSSLTEIRTLHAQGVLSTEEMTAAIQRQRQATLGAIDVIKGRTAAEAAAAAAAAAAEAAAAAQSAELQRLTAQFNPLVAAQQKYKTALDQIEQAQRLGAISASQAIDLKLRERNTYETLASSMERVAAAQKRAIEGAVARITITPDRGADISAYGEQLDKLRARYNPLFSVVTSYKAALADIREAHKVGAISADEMSAAISRQRQATLASIDAIKGRNNQRGDGSDREGQFRRQNLTYQLFDIGQSSALGMPVGMVAAQQLPQIIQLYAGQGGVNAALKDLGTIAAGATRLITPLTVGVGGLAAVAVTGLAAWNGYLTSMKEVETAASGLGRAVAGSATQMEAAAAAAASAAGISVSSARSMQAQFLSTGRIGSENFEKLIAISKDFAATIGIDAGAAGDALSEMFADPAKAADTLYRQYGLISAATARQVTNLAQQNRVSEAQAVLLEALPNRLASAAEATTALGRAWAFVTTSASNAYDAMGRAIDRTISGPTLDEQLAEARKTMGELKESPLSFGLRIFSPSGAQQTAAALRVRELEEQIRQRDERNAELQRQAEEVARSRAAISIAEGSSANAGGLQQQVLRNQIEALRSANGISGIDGTQRGMIDTAIEAKTRALDALINRQQRTAELDRLDIQIQSERNPLIRAELEARRTRLQMADQEVSSAKIEEEAGRARNRVIGEAIASSRLQAQDLTTEVGIRTSLNAEVAAGNITSSDAQILLEQELQLRPLLAAAAVAEGDAKQQLLSIISQLRDGYAGMAEAQKEASAAAIIRDQQTELETLRAEISLVGQSEAVRRRSLALLRAEQTIRSEGIAGDSARAQTIRANAAAIADMNTALDRANDAWDRYRSAGENAIDGVVDALSEGNIEGALKSVASELTKGALDLGIKNPLKNALLGTNYGTINDLMANPTAGIAGLFGDGLNSMAVTAGTVIVNGGIAGGTSSFGYGAANSNIAGGYSGLSAAGGTGIAASAVDRAMGMLGASETGDRGAVNTFLKAGGVDIDAARTAWCAGFVNSALEQVGVSGSGSLLANSFQQWGSRIDPSQALRGDVLLDSKGLAANQVGGHVGLATGARRITDGQLQLQMLSGNSSDAVSLDWINASQVQARRAMEAANAMRGLSANAAGATQNLGTFGSGLGQLGQNLSSAFTGGSANSGGGLLSSLLGGAGRLIGGVSPTSSLWAANSTFGSFLKTGFSRGGWTGYGASDQPAGVVHKNEIVWSQADIARAGGSQVVEAMRLGYRGYERGGMVGGSVSPRIPANDTGSRIQIYNYSSQPVTTEETMDEYGRRQTKFVIGEAVGDSLATKGTKSRRSMEVIYGVRPKAIAR